MRPGSSETPEQQRAKRVATALKRHNTDPTKKGRLIRLSRFFDAGDYETIKLVNEQLAREGVNIRISCGFGENDADKIGAARKASRAQGGGQAVPVGRGADAYDRINNVHSSDGRTFINPATGFSTTQYLRKGSPGSIEYDASGAAFDQMKFYRRIKEEAAVAREILSNGGIFIIPCFHQGHHSASWKALGRHTFGAGIASQGGVGSPFKEQHVHIIEKVLQETIEETHADERFLVKDTRRVGAADFWDLKSLGGTVDETDLPDRAAIEGESGVQILDQTKLPLSLRQRGGVARAGAGAGAGAASPAHPVIPPTVSAAPTAMPVRTPAAVIEPKKRSQLYDPAQEGGGSLFKMACYLDVLNESNSKINQFLLANSGKILTLASRSGNPAIEIDTNQPFSIILTSQDGSKKFNIKLTDEGYVTTGDIAAMQGCVKYMPQAMDTLFKWSNPVLNVKKGMVSCTSQQERYDAKFSSDAISQHGTSSTEKVMTVFLFGDNFSDNFPFHERLIRGIRKCGGQSGYLILSDGTFLDARPQDLPLACGIPTLYYGNYDDAASQNLFCTSSVDDLDITPYSSDIMYQYYLRAKFQDLAQRISKKAAEEGIAVNIVIPCDKDYHHTFGTGNAKLTTSKMAIITQEIDLFKKSLGIERAAEIRLPMGHYAFDLQIVEKVKQNAGIASGSSAGAAGSFVAPVASGALAGAGIGIGGAGARVDGHHDHDKLPIVGPNTKWNASQQEMTILLKHTPDEKYITTCKDFVFLDKKYSYSHHSQFAKQVGVGKMTFAPFTIPELEKAKYAFSIGDTDDAYQLLRNFKREVLKQNDSEPESVAGVYASSRIAQALVVAQEKVKDTSGVEFNKNQIAQIITIARNCGGFSKRGDNVIAGCLESVSDEYRALDDDKKSAYLKAVRNFSAEFQKSVGEYLKTGNVAATNPDAGFRTKRMTMDHVACILSDSLKLASPSGATIGLAAAQDMDRKVNQALKKFPSPDFVATSGARLGPGRFHG